MQPKIKLLGGVVVYIYGLEHVRYVGNQSPLIVFVTHGRNGSAHDVLHICNTLVERDYRRGTLLCVAVDQRNHGRRLCDERRNASWSLNPSYPVDIYATLYGTAMDFICLADVLPLYLNLKVDTFAAIGVAMGSYTVLLAMAHDTRFRAGVSLIGFSSYLDLLEHKAKTRNRTEQYLSDNQLSVIRREEPVEKLDIYKDRSLFFIFGGRDNAIPRSCSDPFINQLTGLQESTQLDASDEATSSPNFGPGNITAHATPRLNVYVEEGCGHELTPTMVSQACEWLHRWKNEQSSSIA